MPIALLQWLGAALLLHSGHLLLVAARQRIRDLEIYYFSSGDLLWFLASLWLLSATDLVNTGRGAATTLCVAVGVAIIGIAQLWCHAEEKWALGLASQQNRNFHLPYEYTRLQAITASWWCLPRWVKIWLFALNVVFLAGIAFWEEEAARIVLAAWVAAGPLLAAFMVTQRGLTRLLGVAHLIPWIPLVLYLELRLLGSSAGPQITWGTDPALFTWVLILLAFTYVCLMFDVYDLLRWGRGERWRIGSDCDQCKSSSEEAVT
ncbi:MAG: hypothetical protein RLP45_06575 [Haliea sp.]